VRIRFSGRWRTFAFVMLFLIVCTGVLSACGGSGMDMPADRADETQKLRVILDWYPNAVHAFLYVAKEKGYFADEGLDVEIQMPSETNDPLRLVAANQADLAFSYQPQLVMAAAEGVPGVAVAAVVRHPLNALMVRADHPIRSPKDLEGRTVGYPSVPTNEAVLKTMVKADGGDPDQVRVQDVGWEIMQALSTQRVDAVLGGYINHEKLLLEKHGVPVRVIAPVQYGVPDYYELIVVTSPDTLAEKREAITAFWRAAQRGYTDVVAAPEEALEVLFRQQSDVFTLEEDIERQSLEVLLPLMDAGDQPFGYQDVSVWEQVIQWLHQEGVIERKPDVEQLVVNLVE